MSALIAMLVLGQTPTEAKLAIEAGYKSWSKHYVAKDFKVIESLCHKDFVMISEGKKRTSREGFLKSIKASFEDKDFKMLKFDIKVDKVEKKGNGWLATITEKYAYALKGKETKAGQRTADLWVKSDKGWQVISTEMVERLKD